MKFSFCLERPRQNETSLFSVSAILVSLHPLSKTLDGLQIFFYYLAHGEHLVCNVFFKSENVFLIKMTTFTLLYFFSLGGNQREKTSTNDRSGFELQKVVPRKMTQEIKQVYPDVYQVFKMIYVYFTLIGMSYESMKNAHL